MAQKVSKKVTTKVADNSNQKIVELFSTLKPSEKKKILNELAGGSFYSCYMCNEIKPKTDFYSSTDPKIKSGITRICKKCAENIVYSVDEYGEKHEPTKQSLFDVLEYLDKVYDDKLFDSSIAESMNVESGKKRSDFWCAYIKSVGSLPQYQTSRWRDSDNFKKTYRAMELGKPQDIKTSSDQTWENEILSNYERNKKDVIKFVKYDPFKDYPRESEKPMLYAQLVNFLDDETKNDGMKLSAVLQIVKKLNQAEKLNNQIDLFINDIENVASNQPLINKMADTYSKLMKSVNDLAKDNGISVNHNNNKSKGANTLSGKMKLLAEIGFRDAKINTFDIGTCEGMRQVALISEEARHKQIGYDENIAQEIKDIKVELVETLTRERDESKEFARKLLLENKDLKEFLKEKGLIDENGMVIE